MMQQDNASDAWSDDDWAIAAFIQGLAAGRRDASVCSANITHLRGLEQRGDILTAVVDMRGVPHEVALLRIVTTAAGEQLMSHAVRTFLRDRQSDCAPGYIGLPMGGDEFLYCFVPVTAGT